MKIPYRSLEMKKFNLKIIITCVMMIIVFVSMLLLVTFQKESDNNINKQLDQQQTIKLNLDYNPGGQRVNINSDIFNTYSYVEDWDSSTIAFHFIWFDKKSNYDYSIINDDIKQQNTVFIIPIFTHSAYLEKGFYDYFRNTCDDSCLTKTLELDHPFMY